MNEDDAAIVTRCLAGDIDAYEAIVSRYQRGLFNVALRMLGNYGEAQDTTQNALVKAYQHLDSYDRNQRFVSWIYRILRNECLNVLRARRTFEEVSPDLQSAGGTAADGMEAKERRRLVQNALLGLPADYREVILLRYFTDLSYDEIALAVGVPTKTVKSRLYTARQRLGETLTVLRVTS